MYDGATYTCGGGALTLARAVDDPELSDRILTAARTRLTARQSRAVSTLVS
jgi:hypothetical protein